MIGYVQRGGSIEGVAARLLGEPWIKINPSSVFLSNDSFFMYVLPRKTRGRKNILAQSVVKLSSLEIIVFNAFVRNELPRQKWWE